MKNTITEIYLKYNPIRSDILKIKCSKDAYNLILAHWDIDTIELYEEFKIMLLNKANEVLGINTLSKGGISGTTVDIKLLFAVTLKTAASGIILIHNHPSGNLKPSQADMRIIEKIKKGAEYLDICILDNLIISKDGYFSFTDENLI